MLGKITNIFKMFWGGFQSNCFLPTAAQSLPYLKWQIFGSSLAFPKTLANLEQACFCNSSYWFIFVNPFLSMSVDTTTQTLLELKTKAKASAHGRATGHLLSTEKEPGVYMCVNPEVSSIYQPERLRGHTGHADSNGLFCWEGKRMIGAMCQTCTWPKLQFFLEGGLKKE